jgi:putative transposase
LPFVPLALYLTHVTHHLTKSDVKHHNRTLDGVRTVAKHRHTVSEIAKKLATADEMAAQGRLQGDIAKSLGISVMTYHRWRKARGAARPVTETVRMDMLPEREQMSQIRELQLENTRLRRLVTDLMLEKVALEEGLAAAPSSRRKLAHG